MIIDHNHPDYIAKRLAIKGKYNGAYYYSIEIGKYFIPTIKTTRSWVTVNVPGNACDHAIVFIHNNVAPGLYDWLASYKDLVLVCGIPETVEKVKHLGKAIYLPLSVDVKEVEQYITKKTQDTAFVGRAGKRRGVSFPLTTHFIENVPREQVLKLMAQYRKVYAVGRTAIEAKILNCEVLPYDPRFTDPDRWQVLDSTEAAKLLQKELDKIDKPKKTTKGKDTGGKK